jgi:hypothetical protein
VNDLLYITQFSSKWQIAPFYKIEVAYWIRCLISRHQNQLYIYFVTIQNKCTFVSDRDVLNKQVNMFLYILREMFNFYGEKSSTLISQGKVVTTPYLSCYCCYLTEYRACPLWNSRTFGVCRGKTNANILVAVAENSSTSVSDIKYALWRTSIVMSRVPCRDKGNYCVWKTHAWCLDFGMTQNGFRLEGGFCEILLWRWVLFELFIFYSCSLLPFSNSFYSTPYAVSLSVKIQQVTFHC